MGKSTILSMIPSHQGPGIARWSFMYDSVHGSEMLQGNVTSVPLSLVLKILRKVCFLNLCPWFWKFARQHYQCAPVHGAEIGAGQCLVFASVSGPEI